MTTQLIKVGYIKIFLIYNNLSNWLYFGQLYHLQLLVCFISSNLVLLSFIVLLRKLFSSAFIANNNNKCWSKEKLTVYFLWWMLRHNLGEEKDIRNRNISLFKFRLTWSRDSRLSAKNEKYLLLIRSKFFITALYTKLVTWCQAMSEHWKTFCFSLISSALSIKDQ